MPHTAPAIAFTSPGRVEVIDVHVPDPGPAEVLVRTAYSGVSQGTERWLLTGKHKGLDTTDPANYPFLPGYQAAGVVEAVGSEVDTIRVGDPVAVEGTRIADPGIRNRGAGLASHVGLLTADAAQAVCLEPTVDLAEAALYRMAGVARHGVRLAQVAQEEVVVVLGLGLIGQMAAQAARLHGGTVIASDLLDARVEAARQYSADIAVNGSAVSLRDVVREVAPDGADVVIDTTGNSSIFPTCLELVRVEGRISLQGYYPDPIVIDFHPTHQKRATVVFPCAWDGKDADDQIAADLASGALKIGPLITHRVPFRDAADAYTLILEAPQDSLGMVFDWVGAR